MSIYSNGSAIYGEGGAAYDISEQAFLDCCCRGLIVSSVSISVTGSPDCNLVQQSSPFVTCTKGRTDVEGAVTLAQNYINASNYITRCRPTIIFPDPETNFCQNATPEFSLYEITPIENGYIVYFIVEDCGIPPEDAIAAVTVNYCT